ncbi:hypothetical protein L596_025101 [Steinernema carpocapsae]|uniref:Uncharacterized protein n=1 Tax=Steinernema carpocapsae TaxID=34508 RepID=A0A4V5ZYQ0_STECR|nr:hypothetical protein L596_025101 [Steinernema carpocapsae]
MDQLSPKPKMGNKCLEMCCSLCRSTKESKSIYGVRQACAEFFKRMTKGVLNKGALFQCNGGRPKNGKKSCCKCEKLQRFENCLRHGMKMENVKEFSKRVSNTETFVAEIRQQLYKNMRNASCCRSKRGRSVSDSVPLDDPETFTYPVSFLKHATSYKATEELGSFNYFFPNLHLNSKKSPQKCQIPDQCPDHTDVVFQAYPAQTPVHSYNLKTANTDLELIDNLVHYLKSTDPQDFQSQSSICETISEHYWSDIKAIMADETLVSYYHVSQNNVDVWSAYHFTAPYIQSTVSEAFCSNEWTDFNLNAIITDQPLDGAVTTSQVSRCASSPGQVQPNNSLPDWTAQLWTSVKAQKDGFYNELVSVATPEQNFLSFLDSADKRKSVSLDIDLLKELIKQVNDRITEQVNLAPLTSDSLNALVSAAKDVYTTFMSVYFTLAVQKTESIRERIYVVPNTYHCAEIEEYTRKLRLICEDLSENNISDTDLAKALVAIILKVVLPTEDPTATETNSNCCWKAVVDKLMEFAQKLTKAAKCPRHDLSVLVYKSDYMEA